MFVCIYRPPKQDSQYFLENLSLITDHYSSIYDNHIILGDFNMEPKNPKLVMHSSNSYNSIKLNTCFKSSGSCIDLILTNWVITNWFCQLESTALNILLLLKQGLVIIII